MSIDLCRMIRALSIHPAVAISALAASVAACGELPVPAPTPGRHPEARQKARHATPDKPALRRLENGHYRVKKAWMVRLKGKTWHVQKGYTSNGITAPEALKKKLGDGVEHPETWAAVFHDWLFTQPGMSRAKADSLFRDLLLSYGVDAEKARLMHTTVSLYTLSKKL